MTAFVPLSTAYLDIAACLSDQQSNGVQSRAPEGLDLALYWTSLSAISPKSAMPRLLGRILRTMRE